MTDTASNVTTDGPTDVASAVLIDVASDAALDGQTDVAKWIDTESGKMTEVLSVRLIEDEGAIVGKIVAVVESAPDKEGAVKTNANSSFSLLFVDGNTIFSLFSKVGC